MATVQEHGDTQTRYQRAIQGMLEDGLEVTQLGIVQWLKENDGVGCSQRDAHAALDEYRERMSSKELQAVMMCCNALAGVVMNLPADSQYRVLRQLDTNDAVKGMLDEIPGGDDFNAEQGAKALEFIKTNLKEREAAKVRKAARRSKGVKR